MNAPELSAKQDLAAKQGSAASQWYAIVRIDEFLGSNVPLERKVTVKRIVQGHETATREVERLNRLQQGKEVHYFLTPTRIDQHKEQTAAEIDPTRNRLATLMPTETPAAPRSLATTLERIFVLPPMVSGASISLLQRMCVPEYVWKKNEDAGFGFSSYAVLEICKNPTARNIIKWSDLEVIIYAQSHSTHTDLVCVHEHEDGLVMVPFALRALPDLCSTPLADLTPLEIVEKIAERFGFEMMIGANAGIFFREVEFPVPTIILPGANEPRIVNILNPPDAHVVSALILKMCPPTVRVCLAFAIDVVKYGEWLKTGGQPLRYTSYRHSEVTGTET